MNTSQEILNEIRALAPSVADLDKNNVYEVPAGYFENFSQNVLGILFRSESPVAVRAASGQVMKVPDGYFDTLSDNILMKVREESQENSRHEIQRISPVLASLQNINVFSVPFGYFESLKGSASRDAQPAAAKIITMKPRKTWYQVAAAAIVTGVIAMASLQLFNSEKVNSQIAATVTITPGNIASVTAKQISDGIAALSADEIASYLETNGNILDNGLLMQNTDVSELPNQLDYLENENTLNLYLDKINSQINSN